MFKSIRKTLIYTTSGLSACYCTLRFICSLGKCEDVSMEPTIQHGDIVLITPYSVDYRLVNKGDVVFCRSPKVPGGIICKRLVGMEGDTVHNDLTDTEEYISRGHIWLEGDNREASIDSRDLGQIPYGLLISKVALRIWPLHRIGVPSLSSPQPSPVA